MRHTDGYLDGLIKVKLFERMPICMNCGSRDCLDPAHIIGRSNHTLRWDILNLVTLCRICHSYFDGEPEKWEKWWTSRFPERVDYLRRMEKVIFNGDTDLILKYIKSL